MEDQKNNPNEPAQQSKSVKPDSETLHTPDPQKNMEGPVSSLMHQTGEAFNTEETKGEADQKREENR